MKIRLEFKPQDLWIGLFWKVRRQNLEGLLGCTWTADLWICLLPTLPLHFTWSRLNEDTFWPPHRLTHESVER